MDKTIEKLISNILEQLDLAAQIEVVKQEDAEDTYKVILEGEDLSMLIGHHGRVLDSLQHIVNISINKGKEQKIRIIIDINNYRSKREEYLVSYAQKAALSARETMQPITLPPMVPAERRIIHLALQNENDIVTTSEGEEPERYIVVSPKA